MTFTAIVSAFGERFLSERSFELILAPALADHDIDREHANVSSWLSYIAVLSALLGAVQLEMARQAASFVQLAALSFSYFIFPIALGIRIFKTWSDFAVAVSIVLVMSLIPVMVCFWPERRLARPTE